MRRKIAALFLAFGTAVSCAYSANAAASSITVPVNSVVQLGDNVVVGSNAISETDLMKKYDESKEQIASSYSDVDSNRGHLFDDLLPPSDSGDGMVSDADLGSKSNRKSLTLEEFKALLGDQGELPEDNPLADYEKSLKEKLGKQREDNKITAEYMKDFYDKVRKGINPFTGEPFDKDDNFMDENEAARNAAQENMQLTAPGGNGSDGGSGGSPFGDQFQQNLDDMSDFIKDQYEDLLKKKKYSQVKHKKLDESEYIDDELVYQRDNDNITDIHYRCSKCGQLYGFDEMCDCDVPKYLDGTVYQYYKDNGWFSYNWGFNHFDEDGVSVDNSVFSHFVKQRMECGLCGKKLTLESIDFKADDDSKFYIGSNGAIKCHECQRKYGSDLGMNDEDITEWGNMFDPHFDEFISPCTPLLPNNSDIETDDDMFDYFLSTVPEEKRAEFENLRDTFQNGSEKDVQKAFLDTIQSEEDWVTAMNLMFAYDSGGPKAAFNTFMSNIPDDKKDQFKDIKAKFEAGDDDAAFASFLSTIKGEEEWNTAGHLFDKYQNEGMDSAFEYFLDNVPEENRARYREAYDKFKSSSSQTQQGQQTPQAAQQKKQENDKLIEEYAKKYYPDNNKPMDEWTAEDYEEMYNRMMDDFNKTVPPAKKQNGKKIKETSMMNDNANKIFGEWTANQDEWTKAQWDMYNDFCEKYGHDETYLDMVDKGVFDADKSPDEVSKAIDEYIAGFTSVSDKLTLVTTVDYTDIEDLGQGGSYDVKGNTRAIVTNESGSIVAERESVGGLPMTWVAYETGHYMVRRYVDVYHIEWSFKKCTVVMNAEVILPDGTPVEVISGHEETRIIEDKDGFKQTNCQTLEADSFAITVVEGNLDTDKADFYDTERVK